MTARLIERLLARPERNVGRSDFGTRVVACLGLLALLVAVSPPAHVPFSLIKISLLIAAELGLVILMLGLFLRVKTYFAGAQLFTTSLLMLWLERRHLPWVGIAVGGLFLAVGVANLVTRRSRFNQLLGVSSAHEVAPSAPEPAAAAPLHSFTNGTTQ